MASLNQIVLSDRGGEELFAGESMLSSTPPPPDPQPPSTPPEAAADDEPCPDTLRSSVFARAIADQEASSPRSVDAVTIAENPRAA